MPKHLYFICPTDHLETVINRHYNEENYFISSLGNSIDFNKQFTAYLCDLVEAKGITEISFVLAQDNTMFNNPQKNKLLKNMGRPQFFYDAILKPNTPRKDSHQVNTITPLDIGRYLSIKVQEFNIKIWNRCSKKVLVNAKIYQRELNIFLEVNSNSFSMRHICLN